MTQIPNCTVLQFKITEELDHGFRTPTLLRSRREVMERRVGRSRKIGLSKVYYYKPGPPLNFV